MTPGEFGFLVAGASRSGTNVLTALLGSHPRLQVGSERHHEHLLGLVPETASSIAARLSGFRAACEQEAKERTKIWGNRISTENIEGLSGMGTGDDEKAIEPFLSHFSELKTVPCDTAYRERTAILRIYRCAALC